MNHTLYPRGPIASAVTDAEHTFYFAARWLHRVMMCEIARKLRGPFPTAAAIVIDDEARQVQPDGVLLAGILDSAGAALWSATQDDLAHLQSYRTADNCTWDRMRVYVEIHVDQALGQDRAQDHWAGQPGLADLLGRPTSDEFLYRAELPGPEQYDGDVVLPAAELTPEQAELIATWNTSAAFLPITEPDTLPAIELAGVQVYVYVDCTQVPTLNVSVHLDNVAEELKMLPGGAVPVQVDLGDGPVGLAPISFARSAYPDE